VALGGSIKDESLAWVDRLEKLSRVSLLLEVNKFLVVLEDADVGE
jgi:hypothetical protein